VAHRCARNCGIARERDLIIVTTAALSMALKFLSLGNGHVILIEDSSSSDADGGQLIVGSPCVSAAAATPPRFGTRPCKSLLAPAVYISTCDPRFSFHRCTNAPLVVTVLASVATVLPAVASVLILMIPALLLELE
jgi:hypothetical protein